MQPVALGTTNEGTHSSNIFSRFWSYVPSWSEFLEYVRQAWIDIKSRKLASALGVLACFSVVFTMALLISLLTATPIIFTKLAENLNGQIDLQLEAAARTGNMSVNFTALLPLSDQLTEYRLCPRFQLDDLEVWSLGGCASSANESTVVANRYSDPTGRRYPVPLDCNPYRVTSATLVLYDAACENAAGIGEAFEPKGTPPAGAAWVHSGLTDAVGAAAGQILLVQFDGLDRLGALWRNATGKQSRALDQLWVPVRVQKTFSKSKGKFANGLSKPLLLDLDAFAELLSDSAPPNTTDEVRANVATMSLRHAVERVLVQAPERLRRSMYTSSSYDKTRAAATAWANHLLYLVGSPNALGVSMPVLDGIAGYSFFQLFLGLLINLMAIVLLILAVLLIHSLLLVSVETRQFDVGVLRMLGMARLHIVILVLLQAYAYAIVGWILGLLAAGGVYIGVRAFFRSLLSINLRPTLAPSAVLIATVLGLLLPLLGALLPVRRALSSRLRDALDTRRSRLHAVVARLSRSRTGAINPAVVVVGLAAALFGFFIYYLFPLALLSENFALLLNMFFLILLGMLLGLVLLALNFQHVIERTCVQMFLWVETPAVRQLVLKNLTAHRRRNRQTSLMFAMSLGFVVFLQTSYLLQITSFKYSLQQQNGAFVKVVAGGVNSRGLPHTLNGVAAALEQLAMQLQPQPVKSFGWLSLSLATPLEQVAQVQVSNVGHAKFDVQQVYGASPNLFDVAIQGFLKPRHYSKPYHMLDFLYSANGSASAFLGATYGELLGVAEDESVLLEVTLREPGAIGDSANEQVQLQRLRVGALLTSGPRLYWSRYPLALSQDMLLTLPGLLRLLQRYDSRYHSVDQIPLKEFFLQLDPGQPKRVIDSIKRRLEAVLSGRGGVSIFDYQTTIAPTEVASQGMALFFGFTIVVGMAISFFSLSSSMYTNIRQSHKEIAVLRCLGVSRWQLRRAFCEEAWMVVLSSCLLGLLIGVAVGFTMSLQQQLFTQLPVAFFFPWQLALLLIVVSSLMGVAAALGPTNRMLKMQPVQILRSTF